MEPLPELAGLPHAELLAAAERIQAMANRHPALLWISDESGQCVQFNEAWLAFRGRTLAQEYGDGWLSGVHPQDSQACMATYLLHFAERTAFEMQYRLARHDGEYRLILDAGAPWYHSSGQFAGFVGSCLDITDHVRVRRDLRRGEVLYRDAIEALSDGVLVADSSGRVLTLNGAAHRMLGAAADGLLGRPLGALADALEVRDTAGQVAGDPGRFGFPVALIGDGPARAILSWSTDGESIRWFEVDSRPLREPGEGRPFAIVISISDVTEHRELVARAEHDASVDQLTGLVNRRGLRERAWQLRSRAPRRGSDIAVAYCDIDDFKSVNDKLGHEAGDRLLLEVSGRIAASVRSGDVVGRVGGDEIVVVLDHVAGVDGALRAAEKIRASVRVPIPIAGTTLVPTVSIGVSLLDRGADLEAAIGRADEAMYRAKRAGRDRVVLFG